MSRSKHPAFVYRALRQLEDALDRQEVSGEPVLLAVSGGGDSMALLELMALVASRRRLELHLACIDHGLRKEAVAERELVREAARRCGAVFHAASIDPGPGDEDTLRHERHRALEEIAAASGCRLILLGHTADDQIETIVFRFLRGAGLGGLAGMRERRGRLLRPLLGLRREELRGILRERGTRWTDDASNESDRYARGRLRRSVLPAIANAFGSGALDHLLDVAAFWRRDEEFLEEQAARLLAYASRRGEGGSELDLEALASGPLALRSRVLRRWIVESTGRGSELRSLALIERWLDGSDSSPGRLDVPGATLLRSDKRIRVLAADESSRTARSGVDIEPPSADRSQAAHENAAPQAAKGVLPPSGARVRFRRY